MRLPSDLTPIACMILHALLDQHEQPGRQQVRRVRINETQHAAYFSSQDVTPRQQTNEVLRHLEQQNLIRLHWRTWETNNWLESVDLVPEQTESLYTLLKRTPRSKQAYALSALIDEQTPHDGWHASFLAWVKQQLDAHRSVAPLDLDDPKKNRDLLLLLDAIANLNMLTMERTLSTRLFANSKRFDDLRSAVLTILRKHDPDSALYGDDNRALLRAHQIDRVPEYIPLAGPLILHAPQTDATNPYAPSILDLNPFFQGLALPANTLRLGHVVDVTAQAVMTIENETSFHEMLLVRPPSLLVLCTSGFASPALIALLRHIRHARPDIPFFHWGDLDAGGLRILLHLRIHVGCIQTLAMNRQTFTTHSPMAQPLTEYDKKTLKQLHSVPELADCVDLIDCLLETGKKLEQESISATQVLQERTG